MRIILSWNRPNNLQIPERCKVGPKCLKSFEDLFSPFDVACGKWHIPVKNYISMFDLKNHILVKRKEGNVSSECIPKAAVQFGSFTVQRRKMYALCNLISRVRVPFNKVLADGYYPQKWRWDVLSVNPCLPVSRVHYIIACTYPTLHSTCAVACCNVGWKFPWQLVSLENSQIWSKAVKIKVKRLRTMDFYVPRI